MNKILLLPSDFFLILIKYVTDFSIVEYFLKIVGGFIERLLGEDNSHIWSVCVL